LFGALFGSIHRKEYLMKRSTLAVLLLALASTAAFADNDEGFYAGVGVGQFNVEISNVSSATFKGDDTVYKVFGGYRMSSFLGFELDYVDLGSASDTVSNVKIETKINGWAPYVTGTIALGPIELLGRLGYYFYNIDVKGTSGAIAASGSKSTEDLVYGVGIGITLFERLHARLEYEEFDLGDTKKSNAVWLSGAWRF
jgi:OOP family OmpA-OmpF porin